MVALLMPLLFGSHNRHSIITGALNKKGEPPLSTRSDELSVFVHTISECIEEKKPIDLCLSSVPTTAYY